MLLELLLLVFIAGMSIIILVVIIIGQFRLESGQRLALAEHRLVALSLRRRRQGIRRALVQLERDRRDGGPTPAEKIARAQFGDDEDIHGYDESCDR